MGFLEDINAVPKRCPICGVIVAGMLWAEVVAYVCHKCKHVEIDPHPIHQVHFAVNSNQLSYAVSVATTTSSNASINYFDDNNRPSAS